MLSKTAQPKSSSRGPLLKLSTQGL